MSPALSLACSAALVPKAGESDADCEDALGLCSQRSPRMLRAVVSDGATSSAFSSIWSQLLVKAFLERPFFDSSELASRLPALGAAWTQVVYATPLPWHAVERAKRGAFATIAGIEISNADGAWRAIAIGDSAMFVFAAGELTASIPFARSGDFPAQPHLVASTTEGNAALGSGVRVASGRTRPGETIVLATDAAALMLLQTIERGGRVDEVLRAISGGDARGAVERYRASGTLRNDDVATVVVSVT